MSQHLFTVDLEDYFHVSAFEPLIPRDDWSRFAPRVRLGTDRLLDLLAAHNSTATFFVLGWVARHDPELIRRVHAAGHEVASHTYWHRRIPTVTPAELKQDLLDSKAAIEDACGAEVTGFRAPSFSLVPGTEWAFDVLLECGFQYDSSIFPITRPGYGYPGAPLEPYMIDRPAGRLLEIPLSVLRIGGARIPAAGGGYLRHFPIGLLQQAFRQRARAGSPGVFYIHPWELDPDQPRLDVGTLTRMRHYRGLSQVGARVETLLKEFRFSSIKAWLPSMSATVTPDRPVYESI